MAFFSASPVAIPIIVDLSGNPMTAAETFVSIISKNWSHPPRSVDEAIALYQYVIKSEIDPALVGLFKECVVHLTPAEQEKVKAALFKVPVVKPRWRCW